LSLGGCSWKTGIAAGDVESLEVEEDDDWDSIIGTTSVVSVAAAMLGEVSG
jgi:hypothetical protein